MRNLARALLPLALASSVAAAELRVAIGVDVDAQGAAPFSAGEVAPAGTTPLKEDLAREICRRLHQRCSFSLQPVADILPGIAAGGFDLGFGMFLRTQDRERRFLFSTPTWEASSRLLTTPDALAAYNARHGALDSLDTLRECRVIALAGSAQHAALAARAQAQQIVVSDAPTLAAVIAALADGAADFALVPVFSTYTVLRNTPGMRYEFAGPPLTGEGLGGAAHIALQQKAESLRHRVDAAMAAMRADGTWQRIMRRHLPLGLY